MRADPELIAIEEEAAAWLVERDRGLSHARQREFERWLAADPRHATTFRALAETWTLIGAARPAAETCAPCIAPRRSPLLPLTLAAAAFVIACLGGWRFTGSGNSGETGPFALESVTAVGVLRTVPLPDGSIIQLNTDSAVDVRFSAAERRVALTRGEAHFSVARNPERPFIVSVAGVDVRVVGTVFNVRLRAGAVDVLVTEGKVRVDNTVASRGDSGASPPPAPAELVAGQKLSIGLQAETASAPAPAELSPVEIRQALAWQSRRLDFDAAPLEEIVAEMNRYNRHQLVIRDPRLMERRFGGSFPAGDYDTIVRLLETNFSVVAERKSGETWLRLKDH